MNPTTEADNLVETLIVPSPDDFRNRKTFRNYYHNAVRRIDTCSSTGKIWLSSSPCTGLLMLGGRRVLSAVSDRRPMTSISRSTYFYLTAIFYRLRATMRVLRDSISRSILIRIIVIASNDNPYDYNGLSVVYCPSVNTVLAELFLKPNTHTHTPSVSMHQAHNTSGEVNP